MVKGLFRGDVITYAERRAYPSRKEVREEISHGENGARRQITDAKEHSAFWKLQATQYGWSIESWSVDRLGLGARAAASQHSRLLSYLFLYCCDTMMSKANFGRKGFISAYTL